MWNVKVESHGSHVTHRYDRKKKFTMTLHNMVLLGSMGPPGGGKNLPPNRLTNQFILINMAFPDKAQIQKIYSTMLYHHLRGFDESVYSCIENATMATLEVYMSVYSKLLPTPTKMHYLFSMKVRYAYVETNYKKW